MQTFWKFVAVVLGPGLLSGLVVVAYSAIQVFFLDNCDMKLGCTGGVQVFAFLGSVSLLFSSLGFACVALFYRHMLRKLQLKWVAGLVLLLAAALTAMIYSVGYWPTHSVALTLFTWSIASAFVLWAALFLIPRLAPNNSFKPNPLRGSA